MPHLEQYWLSKPDRGGWITVKVLVRDGLVFEDYTALWGCQGRPWEEVARELREEFGEEVKIERMECRHEQEVSLRP